MRAFTAAMSYFTSWMNKGLVQKTNAYKKLARTAIPSGINS